MQDVIEEALTNIFGFLRIDPDCEISSPEDGVYLVTIDGEELNFLIGFRGQSLDALQSILRLIIFRKTGEQIVLNVDINGYKNQKADKIKNLARKFIDKVRFFEKEIELPRMNPWERRQVHTFVSEYDDVDSESTGEGINRRVVLKPNKK
ncbi:hypothetical protein KKG08_02860 [Patescibacteria group bacterium]|nr:hypothetical protein [Patescibacteria group bacterium]